MKRLSYRGTEVVTRLAEQLGMKKAKIVEPTWGEALRALRRSDDLATPSTAVALEEPGTGRRVSVRLDSPDRYGHNFVLNVAGAETATLAVILPYVGPAVQMLAGASLMLVAPPIRFLLSRLNGHSEPDGALNAEFRTGARMALVGGLGLAADLFFGPWIGAACKFGPGSYLAVVDGRQALDDPHGPGGPTATVLHDTGPQIGSAK